MQRARDASMWLAEMDIAPQYLIHGRDQGFRRDFRARRQRRLDGETWTHLMVDATYVKVRRRGGVAEHVCGQFEETPSPHNLPSKHKSRG